MYPSKLDVAIMLRLHSVSSSILQASSNLVFIVFRFISIYYFSLTRTSVDDSLNMKINLIELSQLSSHAQSASSAFSVFISCRFVLSYDLCSVACFILI